MAKKQRLELTWIGKDKREKLEPRVLIEDEAMSYAAAAPDGSLGIRDNVLIKGDNLLALKALQSEYSGRIKCVFIDPPYNTGSAFTHYNDGQEHSIWLTLIRDRLIFLREILSEDGSIWITIDDNESHYLKVLCDEVFGRPQFLSNVVWEKAYTANQTAQNMSNVHDHILVYARSYSAFSMGKLPRNEDQKAKFKNPDNDPRGPWKAENLSAGKFYSAGQFVVEGPKGDRFSPPKGRYWRCNEDQYQKWLQDERITFGVAGTGRPMLKKFLNKMKDQLTPTTWWPHSDVGSNKQASIDLKGLLQDEEVFQNPKPEQLIERILQLATEEGDVVLDSFAGSGTTGAVAHKMGRRWIMVELHDHADTHIVPRLKKVIDGEDPGGVTEATGWQGGGGFRYFRLAPSLLEKDSWGQYVISKAYKPEMLSEAVCKLMGFTYAPSQKHFWQHGHAGERDFIYVTTQRLTVDALRKLSHEVGEGRTLLVCCRAHDKNPFDNLTVKKIPQAVMAKCEWGRDDYSLNIQEAPPEPITAADLTDDTMTDEGETEFDTSGTEAAQ